MREMLDKKLARFEELERAMTDPAVLGNSARMAAVAREHGSLARLVGKYRQFRRINEEIAAANEMIHGDDEMRELAEAELPELKNKREPLWQELLDMTVGGEDANRARCVVARMISNPSPRPRRRTAGSVKSTFGGPSA